MKLFIILIVGSVLSSCSHTGSPFERRTSKGGRYYESARDRW